MADWPTDKLAQIVKRYADKPEGFSCHRYHYHTRKPEAAQLRTRAKNLHKQGLLTRSIEQPFFVYRTKKAIINGEKP